MVVARAARAVLLGYPDPQRLRARRPYRGSNARLDAMLQQLIPAAVENAHREQARLAEAMTADGRRPGLRRPDWAYYAGQVGAAGDALRGRRPDAAILRPYFELDPDRGRGSSTRPPVLSTASPSGARPTWSATTRTSGLRGARRRRLRPSGCSSATSSPATRQAGRRVDGVARRPVAPARAATGGGQQPQHRRSRRRSADAADPGRGRARCSTSSVTPCTACCPRSPTRGSPAPRSPATSSSTPPRSTRCGGAGPRVLAGYARHIETGEPLPADLVARSAGRRRRSTRAPRPSASWPRPGSTWPGTG